MAAVRFNDSSAKRQTDPAAGDLGTVKSLKRIEDSVAVLLIDARAGIADGDFPRHVSLLFGPDPHYERFSFIPVLDRVRQQILKNLPEA